MPGDRITFEQMVHGISCVADAMKLQDKSSKFWGLVADSARQFQAAWNFEPTLIILAFSPSPPLSF